MPLDGDYEPSTLRDRPAIVMTSVGAKTGKLRTTALMRESSGAERDLWWERAVATWPDNAECQTKTDREFPVFVLDPIASPATGR